MCTVLFAIDPKSGTINANRANNIPGLALLQSADLMVIFARFRELPDLDMKYIVEYVNAGKPVLGIRNATHAFRYSPGKKHYESMTGLASGTCCIAQIAAPIAPASSPSFAILISNMSS